MSARYSRARRCNISKGDLVYCTLDDILQAVGINAVAKLSNDNNPAIVEDSVVNNLIKNNSELIDGYLRGRYALPLINQHQILNQINIDLVKYDLYKRREQVTDRMQESRKELLAILSNIQKGVITLDEGNAETRPSAVSYTKTSGVFDGIIKQFRNL